MILKKVILIILFGVFTTLTCFSQIKFGAKAGLNVSRFYLSPSTANLEGKSRFSYHFGGFVELPFNKVLGFNPEILISNKGSENDRTITNEGSVSLNYLSVPLMFYFKPIPIFQIEMGPEFDFLLSAVARDGNKKTNVNKIYKDKFDMSINGGVKVNLPKSFQIGARYCHGIYSFDKVVLTDDQANPLPPIMFYNRLFQISVGYKF